MSRNSSSPPGDIERNESMPPLPSTMLEPMFPTHERRSPYPDERSSLSAIPSYFLESRHTSTLGSETVRSDFRNFMNYPSSINPESTLITPTSLTTNSPLPTRPRSQSPPRNYHPYGNIYGNTNLSRTSVQEGGPYSTFHVYNSEPLPDQYFGSYNPPGRPAQVPISANHGRGPVRIAPHPQQGSSTRRRQFDDAVSLESQRGRKRRSIHRDIYPVEYNFQDLSEEERVLVHLKQDLKLPWKEITTRWAEEIGKSKHEAALQMQFKRLKERTRVWLPGDIICLAKAVEKIGDFQWEAISLAMLEFGIQEKWVKAACKDKWESFDEQELHMIELQKARDREWSPPYSRYSPNSSVGSSTPAHVPREGPSDWQTWPFSPSGWPSVT